MLSQDTIERLLSLKARKEDRVWRTSGLPNSHNCWGLGKEGRKRLEEEQESRCFLCGEFDSKLQLDHDHKTKEARKLLCKRCNIRLGLFESWIRDSDIAIEEIALYLENGSEAAEELYGEYANINF